MVWKFLKNLFNFTKSTYMEKEIYEQSDIVKSLIKNYISENDVINIEIPDGIKKVALTASGSSYHSAAIAANFLRKYTHLYAQAYYASEIALAGDIEADEETLYIYISQSGETSDTNIALNKIALQTKNTMAITNTKDSSLYRNVNYKVLTLAGKEKAIASTKAMCAQTFCLFLVALKIMQKYNLNTHAFVSELKSVPDIIEDVLKMRKNIVKYAKILAKYDNATVLATGMFYPLAKEAALKIKETSYINTTAYPVGEFLHGHVALLNRKCAVITFINNVNIDFITDVLKKINEKYDTDELRVSAIPMTNVYGKNVINIQTGSDLNFLFGTLILLQLLAFETAKILGRNIDKPEGLSKILK